MTRPKPDSTSTAARKAWQAPRLARLAAGSAQDGAANNEDGSFTAS